MVWQPQNTPILQQSQEKGVRNTKFNERLAALMKEKGETNYALAKALEISNSTVANWLSGETAPIRSHLKQLADHYGATVDELLREEAQ